MALKLATNLLARIQYGLDEHGHWTESGRTALELALRDKRLLEIIRYEAASSIAPAHKDERNSAAFDGAVKALRTFKAGSGATLESYVKIVIRRELISLHRSTARYGEAERLDAPDKNGRPMGDRVASPVHEIDDSADELLATLKDSWLDFLFSISQPSLLVSLAAVSDLGRDSMAAIDRIAADSDPNQLRMFDSEEPGDRAHLIAWQNQMLNLGYEVFDGAALGQSIEAMADLFEVHPRLVSAILRTVGTLASGEKIQVGDRAA